MLAACLLAACAGEAPPPAAEAPVEHTGDCADAYQAQVCTWASVRGSEVVEFGAIVPLASIENTPAEVAMAWPPATLASANLPAAGAASGFTHMTMNWEPMGHGPATYLTPHFDFHFYRIPSAQRTAIDCSDVSKPTALPVAYSLPDEQLPPEVAAMIGVDVLIGVCVPEMGMHSIPTADLTREETFNGAMVVGYYQGQTIFVEPMIPQAVLLERQSFDIPVPAIPGPGSYPTTFRAEYMADQDAYRFVFSGMTAAM
jgi:hypothetical protein